MVPFLNRRFASAGAAIAATVVLAGPAVGSDVKISTARRLPNSELDRSRQLLVVTAPDWNAVSGEFRCFERPNRTAAWVPVFAVPNVALGRSGLAWGVGLHQAPTGDGPIKREGDGKAPAGVFPIVEAFGFARTADAKITGFPYRELTATTEGIDDPASRHYNRIVDARSISSKDWKSSEMMRDSQPYRWGAVVGHNWQQKPGGGSCIFLHVWEGAGVPTSGCTAMPEEQMLRVLRWLDRGKKPVLVQLPVEEYRRVRESWRLP